TEVLSREHLYKTSFSKYGTAYCRFMDKTPAERAHMIAAVSRVTAGDGQQEAGQISTQKAGRDSRFRQKRAASLGRISA
ncbi:MAG: hypothetical protein IKA94_00920, partial [Mogibacterium sp.]|nr:hypothetical protein [Mogibacterium sp.]